jgi:cyclophilin family peptidyl-prolyl cis-trans isomerase
MKWFKSLLVVTIFFSSCTGTKEKIVEIETQFGIIQVKLYNSTPIHRDNFIKLVKDGYYEDLLFHRVIPGFMIQGGDPNSKNSPPGMMLGQGGPDYLLDPEIGELHFTGAIAAARTGDSVNPGRKSSGSQFYIVEGSAVSEPMLRQIENQFGLKYTDEQIQKYLEKGGTPFLDGQYTVFGEVVKGIEVVKMIVQQERDQSDRPLQNITMKARVL